MIEYEKEEWKYDYLDVREHIEFIEVNMGHLFKRIEEIENKGWTFLNFMKASDVATEYILLFRRLK